MVARKTGDAVVQIALRISPELRDRIKLAAESNGRSVNSELVEVLSEKYPEPAPKELIEDVISFLEKLPSQYDKIENPEDKRQLIKEFLTIMVEYGDVDTDAMVEFVMKDFDPDAPLIGSLPKVKAPGED